MMMGRSTGRILANRNLRKLIACAFSVAVGNIVLVYLRVQSKNDNKNSLEDTFINNFVLRDEAQKATIKSPYGDENNIGILSKKDQSFFRTYQEEIDSMNDDDRCKRYGFKLTSDDPVHQRLKPRRIFFGSLIASEPWELFEIAAAETYGMYEGIVLVESNRTQNFSPRNLTHYHHKEKHEDIIERMFGIPVNRTQIRLFVNEDSKIKDLTREHAQRNDILNGWKELGMQPDDVAMLVDMDEVPTRDFLRAVQICDVIDELDYQSHECLPTKMGLQMAAQVYEGSPECITDKRIWFKPTIFDGHCIEGILGKTAIHKPPPREKNGDRQHGWSHHDWNKSNPYHPLCNGGDFRKVGAKRAVKVRGEALAPEMTKRHYNIFSAFHLHNFFADEKNIRFKYKTFGHAMSDADSKPLEDMTSDLAVMAHCARNEPDNANKEFMHNRKRVIGGFESLDPFTPIYFKDADYRWRRHDLIRDIFYSYRKPRRVFVDLGANCGNTYLKHRQEHEEDADEWEVYLWEPSPQMHEFFLNDLKKEYPNIHIIPHAAGVRDGQVKLYVHKGQEHVTDKTQFLDQGKCDPNGRYNPSGATSLFGDARRAGEPVNVKVMNFIKWLEDLKLNDEDTFIFKIDIEGAEYEILEQMMSPDNNLLCLTDLMKIEFHPRISPTLKSKYERFGDDFPSRFKQKCGRDLKMIMLH